MLRFCRLDGSEFSLDASNLQTDVRELKRYLQEQYQVGRSLSRSLRCR